MKAYFCALILIFCGFVAGAQTDTTKKSSEDSIMNTIMIDSIEVIPQAKDIKGMMLLDVDIQNELGGAVDNLYNFKYARAEKQFKSLRRRYPTHPMPYFLMGLSQWWK